jgi:hypothetical protein
VGYCAARRLVEPAEDQECPRSWSDDDGAVAFLLYAGGRLTYLQAEVGVNRGPSPDRSAGDRALSHNYDTGTDGDLFRWEVNMHGLILGLTIRFYDRAEVLQTDQVRTWAM